MNGTYVTARGFVICTVCPIHFGRTNEGKLGGQEKWRVQGKGEKYTGYFVGKPEVNDHLENLGIQERIILKWILKK